ncbi:MULTISPECIES: 50S ribosomal protein L28 [unclassified Mycoplasma]|uniref:50S ribosomal protein L28 n=1 Tax=unclassified Mycoplasma TaxID=2683645 RepID=UPI002B1D41C9|nr:MULTISPECIES: 50S ribosomal protein L28 [unclassified Mycoplasma]MEA4191180.1 50S ribosomal protein L28 [Mycoplasma sp. 2248]MEA4206375.1 50S ribosomal protein L28 [Mycoplasma sp. 1199]MEA4276570.1 50S ribosomal protein L28 [Mycoplasma sp. 21DD0573]MEA4333925.1 50S ribosomal protein L28 [Mycoplasma sp. 1232]WRQ25822.1 50S ribosomal protein L28 [Mycoplasma sp. 888]
MSRRDVLTGRGPQSGNKRSHALNATKRKFNVNLQKVRVTIDGQKMTLRVSAKTLKTLKNKGLI